MLIVQGVVRRLLLRHAAPEPGGTFLGETRFEFSAQGVRTSRQGLSVETQWQRVREITPGAAHLFIWLDQFQAFVVPLRDLNAIVPAAEAQNQFRLWMEAATDRATDPAARPAPPAAGIVSIKTWFSDLLRLWTLRQARPLPSSGAAAPVFILSFASLLIWCFLDWRASVPDPEFSVYGIPYFAWDALGVVALAALLRWRALPAPRFAHVLFLTLGLAPFLFLYIALPDAVAGAAWGYGVGILIGVAATFYLARGMKALTGHSQRFAVLTGIVFTTAFFMISNALNVMPSLWTIADTATTSEPAGGRGEALLFDQSGRIDRELQSIRPAAGRSPAGFFLGFAGVADQKVFAEEVGLAKRVLSEKFGIESRALSLINDERDLDRAPFATLSGLRYALHGLAARMNLEQDVLFLAISSHGSEDPAIAVSNSQLPLNDLTADELADSLRESGIRWRVIIISACYAGGFIDALKDPRTIVITAAARDRTSFGCSNDRDLTYFGEAFYRDSLPSAHTLREAFERARSEIAKRELAEREKPSNPQAYFGADIEARLAAMTSNEH
jgi:hypothetical protein